MKYRQYAYTFTSVIYMGSVGPELKSLNLQVFQNLDIKSKGVFTNEEAHKSNMRVFKLFEAPIKVTTLKRKYFWESFKP